MSHTSNANPSAISASARISGTAPRLHGRAGRLNGRSLACRGHSCGKLYMAGPAYREPTQTPHGMAMIGTLRPASDAEIERLLANPAEITRFLYGSAADDARRVVLNKAWHAIHFVLNGSRLGGNEPLNFLVSEGTPVGDVDVGFGPARVLTSAQVRAIAARLAEISPDEVAGRVNLGELDEHRIYPG